MATQNDKNGQNGQISNGNGTPVHLATTEPTTLSAPDPKTVLPLLTPPADEEAEAYYITFPSRPRLMGRTSSGTDPFEFKILKNGLNPEFQYMVMSDIGNHKIKKVWNDVEPLVLDSLESLPWASVYILRIGKNNVVPELHPVVVWVGIETAYAASVSWDDVALALRKCRVVLDKAGLTDVEVEVRSADVVTLEGQS
ncbi:hypothetical protein Sste5346_004547 [Sporothrix stenoceras]|uniref:Uncharacterized protein n=1 Tax=Sporothrix stenoceras TaxID=5173 RepID=A0ABR3Z773_9PEZI